MGRRGPAPQPTAIKLLHGNPGKRAINRREPKPAAGAPPCPAWLDAEARAEWRRVTPELDRLGLLTVVDAAALAGYCFAYSQWRAAALALREFGQTMTRADGSLVARPEVGIAHRSLALVRAFCQEFGLTPSARARLSVGVEDDGSRLEGIAALLD